MKKPTSFGKYLLLERINVGGMAEIFIAKSFGVEGFERVLAIKKILPTMAEDDEFIRMFIDEARISAQLNHANIVHTHELGKNAGNYFIAMEYVAGRDVRSVIETYRRRRQTMPASQAAFIASKMCEGLDYAHRRKDARGQDLQIIHRDVSPQNILISYEGEVKIIDFGIAKAANRTRQTQAGILKGKFGYMSPEQVRGQPIDRRSDVFAVGVILYEMLTGEKLFVGESDFSTLEMVRNAEVPPPTQFNPDIPPGLEQVLLKALARDPEFRYQWASELQEELMRFLVSGEAIYSSRLLSAFMKETFAEQLRREAERMQRYAGVEGPEVLAAPVAPSGCRGDASLEGANSSAGASAPHEGAGSPIGDGSSDETQIFDPSQMAAPAQSAPDPASALAADATPGPEARFASERGRLESPRAREPAVIGTRSETLAGETGIGRTVRRVAPAAGLATASADSARREEEHPAAGELQSPTGAASEQGLHRETVSAALASGSAARTGRPPTMASAAVAWWMARPQRRLAVAGAALLGLVLGAALLLSSGADESGSILVLVRPAKGVRIEANGKPIAANAIVQLPQGQHLLRAVAPGFAPLERQVTVAAGATPPVIELTLVPQAPEAKAVVTGSIPPAPAPVEQPAQTPGGDAPAAAMFAALFVGEPGAEIRVEGRVVGRTPGVRVADLAVGRRYGFTVTRAGFKPFAGQFGAEGTAQVEVAFKLEREVAAPSEETRRPEAAQPRPPAVVARPADGSPAAPQGRFACSTRPAGAQVWVDGRNTGRQTPIALGSPLLLTVGTHQVVFKLDGRQSAPTSVTITPDAVAKLLNVPLD